MLGNILTKTRQDKTRQDKTRQDKTRQTNYGFLKSAFVKLFFFVFFLSFFLVLPVKAYAASIFSDGFESGNMSAWTSSLTDGGNLSVTTGAKINGNYGLQAFINDNNSLKVEYIGTGNVARYRARFYVNPNSVTIEQYQNIFLFTAFNAAWETTFHIILTDTSTNKTGYAIFPDYIDDAGVDHNLGAVLISNAPHYIEVDWQASSAPGANDGHIILWIDGTQGSTSTGIDTDTKSVDYARLGAEFWWGGTFSGTFYLDDFASNNDGTLIGAFSDTTAPTGGSITYTDGYNTTASVALTVADGTDTQSGINTSTRTVQRKSSTLTNGTCGSYGSFATITTTGTYPSLTDAAAVPVASGNCYQYQYLVSDNSTNQATYISSNTVKVDTAAPASGSITYADGYNASSSVSLTVSDGTDSVSGVNTSSRIVQRKSATLSSGSCGSYGSFGTITPTGTYSSFTDTTVSSSTCYQYQYLVSDNAGNQATYISSNTVYVLSFPSSPSSLAQYQSDGSTSISSGDTLGVASTVVLKFSMSSSNSSDSLTPQIEIQSQGIAFTNTSNYSGSAVSFTGTPVTGTVTIPNMGSGSFHWQARVSNSAGQSSWVSMGGNPDFSIEFSPASNNSSAPVCGDQAPGSKVPWLYGAIAQDSGSVLLYFTESSNPVDKYILEYGISSNNYQYGVSNMGVNSRGQMTFLVKSLSPNTTYYFRIRGGNGCAAGTWSNEISVKTKGQNSTNQLEIISSELIPQANSSNEQANNNGTCESPYIVKSGDSLWNIASKLLGNGSKYQEIIDQNPSLKSNNNLSIDQELKVNCSGNQTPQTGTQQTTQTPAQGGYDVKVNVVDDKKKPVEGATVTMHSTPQTTKTDINGTALFHNVEQGDHKVLIAYSGFQGEQSINLTGDVKEFDLNVTVKPQSVFLSPIVIGGFSVMGLVIAVLGFLLMKSRKSIKQLKNI